MNIYIVVPRKNGFWRRKYIFSFLPRSEVLILCFHFWEHIEDTENLVVWSLIYKYGFANWIPSSACRLRVNMDSKSANNVRKLPSLRLAMTIEMQNQYIDNMLISMFFFSFSRRQCRQWCKISILYANSKNCDPCHFVTARFEQNP